MMSNPDLLRMASEIMGNMRPEDLEPAAQMLNHTLIAEEIAEIGEKMAQASLEEIASMRARVGAQISYNINAAIMLMNQGDELHCKGMFKDALEKYLLAKNNLKVIPSSNGSSLLLACSLNLMSCYLKTNQYGKCIEEGSEVLEYDAKNLEALYRRGQAYKELGQLEDAVSDLSKAHEVSPDDETIAYTLRDARGKWGQETVQQGPRKSVIEEITEEVDTLSSHDQGVTAKSSASLPQPRANGSVSGMATNSEPLQALKEDPEAIRSFRNFISNADTATLASLSGGKTGDMYPEMFKTASNMISKMSPEGLPIKEQGGAHVRATSKRLLAVLSNRRKRLKPLSSDADSTNFQQQRKEALRGYFCMSVEAIQQANCFVKMEGILHELVQHTDDLQEKTIFKGILSRLVEFRARIDNAKEIAVAAEARRSALAGKAADLYSKLEKRQKEIRSLESEFSRLPDEDARKKSISDKLERATEETFQEIEEYRSWEAKTKAVIAELLGAKEKLASAEVCWDLFRQDLGLEKLQKIVKVGLC